MNLQERLKSLNLVLPPPPKPVGSYTPVVIEGRTAYLSGQVSKNETGVLCGKVGKDLTLEEGKKAACAAALNALSVLHHTVGIDRVKKMIRIVGYVQAAGDFYDIPQVVNGASDLFVSILGERGVHARTSVGVASLPMNAAVEIELTVSLEE